MLPHNIIENGLEQQELFIIMQFNS